MKAKTLIGIATGMVLAGLGYFGVKQARLARAVEAELHRARSESTSLLRRATARLARAKADQVARQAELAMVSGPTMPGPAGATPVGVAPSHSIDQMLKEADERLNDPVMQNLQLAARRVDLATWYAPFFRLRGMSPSQVEVFLDLELKDNAGTEDLVAAMRAHGLSLNDPGIQKLGEEIGMGHLPAQRALLGEEGFRQWQEYQGHLEKADRRESVGR